MHLCEPSRIGLRRINLRTPPHGNAKVIPSILFSIFTTTNALVDRRCDNVKPMLGEGAQILDRWTKNVRPSRGAQQDSHAETVSRSSG